MSSKIKIFKNISANAYGQVVTIAIQLLGLPIYLNYWGAALYGEWLILSAIPFYLTLGDLGLASVAGNEMTMRMANNEKLAVLKIYQSIWMFISCISIAAALCLGVMIWHLPIASTFGINLMTEIDAKIILYILVFYVLLSLQGGVLNAGFRSIGSYAYGTTISNSIRFFEWLLSIFFLMFESGPIIIALVMISVRFLGLLFTWILLRRKASWLALGSNNVCHNEIRKLIKPAIAFMAFPLGLALSMQGTVLIIGIALNSTAVVVFTAYRTLSRILVQLVSMLNHALWPEISVAYGAGKNKSVAHLHTKGAAISLWSGLFMSIILYLLGERFILFWSKNSFETNYAIFLLLLLCSFVNVLWQTSWVVLMATNLHQRIAKFFVIITILALIISWYAMQLWGLKGIGLIFLVMEIIMLIYVSSEALDLLSDNWSNHLRSCLKVPNVKELFKY